MPIGGMCRFHLVNPVLLVREYGRHPTRGGGRRRSIARPLLPSIIGCPFDPSGGQHVAHSSSMPPGLLHRLENRHFLRVHQSSSPLQSQFISFVNSLVIKDCVRTTALSFWFSTSKRRRSGALRGLLFRREARPSLIVASTSDTLSDRVGVSPTPP